MIRSRDDAVRAAMRVAAAHGVHSDDPAVLADGFNVIVWLRPAPVVARVVLLPALLRCRVDRMVERELAVTEFLARRGIPVLRPSGELSPGPHLRDGLWMSFWEYTEVLPGVAGPERFAASLRELHAALRERPETLEKLPTGPRDQGEVDGDAPDIAVADVRAFLRHGTRLTGIATADLRLLGAELERLLPALSAAGPVQQVHGDAHPGNLLRTAAGWVWADFEETMRAPVEWDLACVRGTEKLDGERVLREYGAFRDLRPFRRLRELQAVAWWQVIAWRLPEHAPKARRALDDLRAVSPWGRT